MKLLDQTFLKKPALPV